MTIAVGLLCSDSIVLAADTEFTGATKRYGPKVWAWQWDGGLALGVTGAGESVLLSRTADEIRERANPSMTMPEVVRMVEGVLVEMYSKHIDTRPKTGEESDELNVLVAARVGTQLRLFENARTVLARVRLYQCVGWGAALGLMAVADLLHRIRPPGVLGEIIAGYAVHVAKSHSSYCGGDSNIAIIPKSGDIEQQAEHDASAMESYLRAFDIARQPVLFAYANPLQTEETLRSVLNKFADELGVARRRLLPTLSKR